MSCDYSVSRIVVMLSLSDVAELSEVTSCCPDLVGTLSGVSLFEVYEVSVTVTNCSGGCSNLGEGGEDLVCYGIEKCLKTK